MVLLGWGSWGGPCTAGTSAVCNYCQCSGRAAGLRSGAAAQLALPVSPMAKGAGAGGSQSGRGRRETSRSLAGRSCRDLLPPEGIPFLE